MKPIPRTIILGLSMLLMACGGSTEKIETDMNEPNSYEKKNIGSVLALYPSPLTVIGATVDGKVNWTLVAHVFICRIVGPYVAEEALIEQGKIDYNTLKPVLFEFPTYKYLRTGDVIGDCKKMHK